ncbi:isocitrate lyase/phosphoenolpyruvate mutase family protein [Nocardia sp. NBC_00881]|uniref:isocitrate lyase/phosphoenolpyruvate mutase family protein n=1 Tax=Nocardia sp. NBC_00881 TaxID=2975995 RepID=UPI00386BCD8E|nr:isocitrate lyase/phosphoenolpyruvate mutase family protein [Nocardia sp. NBC_00881]
MSDPAAAANMLRVLHIPGKPLILANVWDVATAERVVAAGGRAVGTSSAAIAATLGLPDGPDTPIEPMFAAVRRISSAVEVPVTADLLDGYGLDATELVDRLLAAGAVGCNLEDSDHRGPDALTALLPGTEVYVGAASAMFFAWLWTRSEACSISSCTSMTVFSTAVVSPEGTSSSLPQREDQARAAAKTVRQQLPK